VNPYPSLFAFLITKKKCRHRISFRLWGQRVVRDLPESRSWQNGSITKSARFWQIAQHLPLPSLLMNSSLLLKYALNPHHHS
jgi:hypothetical protein